MPCMSVLSIRKTWKFKAVNIYLFIFFFHIRLKVNFVLLYTDCWERNPAPFDRFPGDQLWTGPSYYTVAQ